LEFLEKRTSKPVLGVIPYFYPADRSVAERKGINLPEEDAIPRHKIRSKNTLRKKVIKIHILCLPHISNFTDFDALESEIDVEVRYVERVADLDDPDVIIIPGTKNTLSDYRWLDKCGHTKKILNFYRKGGVVVGICGGFQILGREIKDPQRVESGIGRVRGLGLLDIATTFKQKKMLKQVKARGLESGRQITGYEIHHGKTTYLNGALPMFEVIKRQGKLVSELDGAKTRDGRVWGTYIHGVFDSKVFRRDFLDRIRLKKGWGALKRDKDNFDQDKEFDKLANLVRNNIDLDLVYKVLKRGL